ncbi:phosphotransferase family protein [Saccharibacillus brassicae]|uniref:Aminoglycoside phosphotransferase family protein n=1 Tax=Saccharibacillus brassicae TaxID=2583377 RepID=A0A4Y6UWE6_SACBS|nr:aminoglycoside phosphotransferase family protein [Saccharibacillus brassicae]QDH20940.1 aminoglycoside phosphotransferase family protein [Saccharibacillus brassicae]
MESVTKRRLSTEEIERIAQKTFGCGCTKIEELTEGWANSAYALDLENGGTAILKSAAESEEGRMRCERGLMRTEVEVMRRLKEAGTVPVPDIYAYDAEKTIVPCEYFLMERLTGTSYDKVRGELPSGEREAIDAELGRFFRQIHEIKGTEFGYYLPHPSNAPSWDDAFLALMRDVMQDGRDAGVKLPMSYEELDEQLERHRPSLRAFTTPTLIHWDSWPGNVLVKDGKVEGIIDFERALWADPLMEYVFGKFMDSPAYETAYGLEGEASDRLVRRALYPLYLDLVMRVECDYRGFGPEHTEWAQQNLKHGWERLLDMTNSL